MGQENPKITFSKPTEATAEPTVEFPTPTQQLVKQYDKQTNFIIGILVIAIVTMLIMTTTLLIDSFHFNSATYKEYSDKISEQNSVMKTNFELLEQNKQNQDLILGELKQIKTQSAQK